MLKISRWNVIPLGLLLAGLALAGYAAAVGFESREPVHTRDAMAWYASAYEVSVPSQGNLLGLTLRRAPLPAGGDPRFGIWEDGTRIGVYQARLLPVALQGKGAYWQRGDRLVFSASDGSDPRRNGRAYEFVSRMRLPWSQFGSLLLLAACFGAGAWLLSRGGRPGADAPDPSPKAGTYGTALATVAAAALAWGLVLSWPGVFAGALFWPGLAAAIVATMYAVALALTARRPGGRGGWDRMANATLAIVSIALVLALTDGALWFLADDAASGQNATPDPPVAQPLTITTGAASITLPADVVAAMAARQRETIFPAAWQYAPLPGAGPHPPFRWHGVEHIYDERMFRRARGPYPAKSATRLRIAIVGDSLTYGFGLDAAATYPVQLKNILAGGHDVEVLNLGTPGLQSEDIVLNVLWAEDTLQPDVIVYGMCLNDFLPAGVLEYQHAWGIPLPMWFKELAIRRSRAARLMDEGYREVLRRLGLNLDFYDDILTGIRADAARFHDDVRMMNQAVVSHGRPAIIGMVLDQSPRDKGRGHTLARMAEQSMREAGFTVIPTDDYYRTYDGRSLAISRWEGHPNEEANAIFATMIANALIARGDLSRDEGRR